MVESTALEMRHTRKGIGGSNPPLSAKHRRLPPKIAYVPRPPHGPHLDGDRYFYATAPKTESIFRRSGRRFVEENATKPKS